MKGIHIHIKEMGIKGMRLIKNLPFLYKEKVAIIDIIYNGQRYIEELI